MIRLGRGERRGAVNKREREQCSEHVDLHNATETYAPGVVFDKTWPQRFMPEHDQPYAIVTAFAVVGFVAPFLGGCSPGSFTRNGDSEKLQTALIREDAVDGLYRATVVLSNGRFGCDLPNFDDPARAQQALQAIAAAACREGAHHLNLSLWRRDGDDWVGDYAGLTNAGPASLTEDNNRLFDGTWYAVNEAFLVETQALDRAYAIADDELLANIGDGGDLVIDTDGDTVDGRVYLPQAGVYANFHAERCDRDATLFALLEASPVTVCP